MLTEKHILLGKTNIEISPIGLGTMQWGDIRKPVNPSKTADKDIHEAFQVSLDMGINFFDTAEFYGNGRSEAFLGNYHNEIPDKIVIATKFMPFPWRLTKGELRSALNQSLKRLGIAQVDLYQIHWPIPPVQIKTWMDAMSDVVADGLVRAVGVSNYSPSQTEIAYNALSKHGIPLASNQIKYNLLDRRPERSGLLDLCKKLQITVIAYSPLEMGILTGKYTNDKVPSGIRLWRYNRSFLMKIKPLLEELLEIGNQHDGKTPGQVSLNWLISKGALPIPGAKNMDQAKQNAGAIGWELTNDEVNKLDTISLSIA
jgi:aryl-alcohol dehydrogenase-like predicted oxidoreductase